ncbi:MAG TPA: cupin domain-containing protein [Usitatibacter sp.]|nr:cupin domain-containing protein [Usitatibacter sp.]
MDSQIVPGTLGDVLYANPQGKTIPEGEWTDLLRRVARSELDALHRLYERASRPVFILAFRITGQLETAEDVTLDVFEDVWRRAWSYDAAEGTVLAWIMNQARTRSRERARLGPDPGERAAGAPPGSSDALAPRHSVQSRLARRIADLLHVEPAPPPRPEWKEPAWEYVAPGIACKLLATDEERERVSMMVRLDPDAAYPPHTHMGREELHLLDGELWIEDRKLVPGDYNRAEATTGDIRVWSGTGCSCVLVTSTKDKLG